MTVFELERLKEGDLVKVIDGASMYASGWTGRIKKHLDPGHVLVSFDHADGLTRSPKFTANELEKVY